VILRDESAARWLVEHDLVPSAPAQLAVDELSRDGLGLTRIWHGPVEGRLRSASRSLLLVLQLDGDLDLPAPDGEDLRVAAGGAFVIGAGHEVSVVARQPAARIEVRLPVEGVFARVAEGPRPVLVAEDRGWARSALISLTNSVLNLEDGTPLLDFDRFHVALLSCAAAFLRAAADPAVRESWSQQLVGRAQVVLERRAADPDCSVGSLARELGVSPAHLARAFQAEGLDTPLRVIRAHRRSLALALLERQGAERDGRPDFAELARLSGFGSVDSLRRALR